MRLTKKKAIDLSIELWTWLAETGSPRKEDWPGWKRLGAESTLAHCFLCEYSSRREYSICKFCPFHQRFGHCTLSSPSAYSKWSEEDNSPMRKKYASEFLELLK